MIKMLESREGYPENYKFEIGHVPRGEVIRNLQDGNGLQVMINLVNLIGIGDWIIVNVTDDFLENLLQDWKGMNDK